VIVDNFVFHLLEKTNLISKYLYFYVYDNGQHGLIAATADQSTGIQRPITFEISILSI
jgi:hypothetical protein